MSIKIESVDKSSQVPEVKFDPAVYNMVLEALQKDANGVVARALQHGVELSQAMVSEVQKQLFEISSKSNKVMNVKINENEMVKLQTEAVPYLGRLIINAKQKLNSMLVGPAGCGKTYAAGQLAEALGLPFGHLNLTAGASETWLFGRQTPNGFVEGTFSKLYRNGGVFLADEIDAADANLMLAINTAIANNEMYNPICGEIIKRHNDFVFIGAANTFGKGGDHKYTGRSRLDAATLDRFIMIAVEYNTKIEEKLCPHDELKNILWGMRKRLIDIQAQEFISSRCMQIAYLQWSGGISIKEIIESITLSWPADIKEEVLKSVNTNGEIIKVSNSPVVAKRKGKKDEIPF